MPAVVDPSDVERVKGHLALLIEAMCRGDADALGRLYDRTSRFVYSLTYRILGRVDEAEEVMVDVYAQLWRHASTFDLRRGSVEAWLATVARSRAIDRLRSRCARPDASHAVRPLDAEALLDRVDENVLVNACSARLGAAALLGTLAPDERRLIELAFFEGYTHSELATALNLPLGTVKTRIRSSLGKMRRAHSAARTPHSADGGLRSADRGEIHLCPAAAGV